jgi:anti-sigma B factor antagonist
MSLEIKTSDVNIQIIVISLTGRLDAFEAPALRKLCEGYIAQNATHFVFDLSDLSMLDSAGLAVMVSVLKRARLKEGDVRLIWPREPIASRILKLTRFDQVFTCIEPAGICPKGI